MRTPQIKLTLIPALSRWRQEKFECKASLNNIQDPVSRTPTKNKLEDSKHYEKDIRQ